MRKSIVLAVLVALTVGVFFVSATEKSEPLKTFPFYSNENFITDEEMPNGYYTVLVLSDVRDGDTFEAWVKVAPKIAYYTAIRLYNVNTPETNRGDCREEGRKVEDRVTEYLLKADEIRVKFKNFDGFGRWVCEVKVKDPHQPVWIDLAGWIRDKGLTEESLCD